MIARLRVNSRRRRTTGDGPLIRVPARQRNPELGKAAGFGLDVDAAAVLLDDDVVTDRQAQARALAGRLGREERVEHLFLDLGCNAGPVIANTDFNLFAEV